MIKKAVIPAAGSGTRLLPATKEMPKGMLPIFTLGQNGEVCLIPTLQAVFEQLYDTGFREFCFIVGRGKRTIEDHFTPDWGFVEDLNGKNKAKLACRLEGFYEKVNSSTIVFVNQPRPKGFGDAVLRARAFTDNEDFLVHASDDLILSEHDDYLKKLIAVFEEYTADAVLLVERVEDLKGYGVIEGVQVSDGIFKVKTIVEKPETPRTNIATIAVYVFRSSIYNEIEKVERSGSEEIQLTTAIQDLIDDGGKIYALELNTGNRIDVGTAEKYWNALNVTYNACMHSLKIKHKICS